MEEQVADRREGEDELEKEGVAGRRRGREDSLSGIWYP